MISALGGSNSLHEFVPPTAYVHPFCWRIVRHLAVMDRLFRSLFDSSRVITSRVVVIDLWTARRQLLLFLARHVSVSVSVSEAISKGSSHSTMQNYPLEPFRRLIALWRLFASGAGFSMDGRYDIRQTFWRVYDCEFVYIAPNAEGADIAWYDVSRTHVPMLRRLR